ncbi:class A sortase [Lactobacillus crispatus]|uniref:Class A sortase n=1 Tax=Lactobacillus crispatus TaxID=47770 RepID=A0ABV2BCD1_9LACO|nr:class A sortase [Lactobacillus crispatus]
MRKNRRQKSIKIKIINTLYVLIGTVMIVLGLTILFFNSKLGRAYVVKDNGERVSQHLTAKQADRNKKVKTTYDAKKTTSVDTRSLWDSRKYPASPIGRMSIPSVNIHNPVFAGYGSNLQNLSYGVCTVVPNRVLGAKSNNYVLAGHFMSGYGPAVLDNLHFTKNGDKIYITDMHKIYEYTEERMAYNITPKQVEVENNIPGKSTVTLITCSDFNPTRYGIGQHRTVAVGELSNVYSASKKNLENFELTDKVSTKIIKKHVRKEVQAAQPKTAKIYNQLSLNQIVIYAVCVIGAIVLICLVKIWVF